METIKFPPYHASLTIKERINGIWRVNNIYFADMDSEHEALVFLSTTMNSARQFGITELRFTGEITNGDEIVHEFSKKMRYC